VSRAHRRFARMREAARSGAFSRNRSISSPCERENFPPHPRGEGGSGRNPISFVVPCHHVIGSSGALTGYHWGLARKRAIIGWEARRT